jgi:hypothetical protein
MNPLTVQGSPGCTIFSREPPSFTAGEPRSNLASHEHNETSNIFPSTMAIGSGVSARDLSQQRCSSQGAGALG